MDRCDYSVPVLQSDQEKEDYLDAIFHGETPFPWGVGGMGVGFTEKRLATAVMQEGGIGTIAGSAIGYSTHRDEILSEPNFSARVARYHAANQAEISAQIRAVRDQMPHGLLAVNEMAAMSDFQATIDTIGQSGDVDMVFVGAGLPRELGEQAAQYPHMRYIPIVSSARAAKAMLKAGERAGNPPAAFYVELPQFAGGHLGAKDETDAADTEKFAPERLYAEISAIAPGIPLILGGGIAYGEDFERARSMGYASALMGTRLLLTDESGLTNNLIESRYLNDDYQVHTGMTSPAGLPSRYLGEAPDDRANEISTWVKRQCVSCIGSNRCQFIQADGPYCIAKRLTQTQQGQEGGVLFTGARVVEMRNDDLYRNTDDSIHIPSIREAVRFVFEQTAASSH